MDDFEKAILFSFDQTGAVDAQLKAQAVAYCEQVKQSPTIWQACLEKFRFSQFPEVQFWCLRVLEETTKVQYLALTPPERMFIRSSLIAAVCVVNADSQAAQQVDVASAILARPVFVRNKLAQIIVILILLEYPSDWSSVFLDLVACLNQGPGVVDMFCRILTTLDEEIISADYPRTSDKVSAATRIKDAMRQQCIPQIVSAWYSLILSYKGQTPPLAVSVLDTMRRYVPWIDISLVANDVFIPLLFECLVSPTEPPQLRGAVAECVLAIVAKKMDAAAKLTLLKQLQIGQVCSRIMEPVEPEESDFALKVSSLLTGVATEILECSKRLDVNGISDQAEAIGLVTTLLDEVLPSVFYCMKHGDADVSSTIFPFLSNYVASMKNGDLIPPPSLQGGLKTKGELVSRVMDGRQAAHVGEILEVIRTRMRFDPGSKDSLDEPDKEGAEEEETMTEYRKDLFTLFRSVYRTAPDVTRSFVHNTLLGCLRNADASFEDVEAAITLLYVLGEGVTDEALKPGGGPLVDMIGTLLSSTIPCHSHRLVALAYLETVTRYVKFLQHHPHYIPPVLAGFLNGRGFHHPNPNVSSRAGYLFMRLVKTLRLQMVPYIEQILQNLQDTLVLITTAKASTLSEDRSYVFEAVGLLVGIEELPVEKQATFLSALLVPLCGQVDAILGARESQQGDPPPATVAALQQLILAISYLSKGFGEHMSTSSRPTIGSMFKQTMEVVLRVLLAFPGNQSLRSKVVSFLHRMVETLGVAVIPFLPAAIEQLLASSDPRDLVEFLQLFNQLVNKFKVAVKDLLVKVFCPLMDKVFALLPKDGPLEGSGINTEEFRELQELQRIFFTFLHAVTTNELSLVLLEPEAVKWLPLIIRLLFDACCHHKDVLVRKVCVQVFTRLIADWCGPTANDEKVPGFRRFVIEQFAAECCVYSVLQSTFDLQDANTSVLLGEIVAAQKILYERCRDDFLMHLATNVLPAVTCPPNLAEQYCLQIQRSDVKDLKGFYRSFVQKVRPHQNGGVPCR